MPRLITGSSLRTMRVMGIPAWIVGILGLQWWRSRSASALTPKQRLDQEEAAKRAGTVPYIPATEV